MSNNSNVPFLDLISPHRAQEEEFVAVFTEALRAGWFIGGPMVKGFEEAFAAFCDSGHAIGVGSGTDALRFALIGAGVKSGESVITVANTFIATTEAITQAGALPVFVDIDERTYNIDTALVNEYIAQECSVDDATGRPVDRKTGRTVTAIVPVHLYGQIADMDPLMAIADKYNLAVVEDACQAHGAKYLSKKKDAWQRAGSIGTASAFSFYPGKNLGAFGEAGAATTDDAEIAGRINMLRDHGQARKYFHDIEGYNGRLDAIQAGILKIKLKDLNERNEARRSHAALYNELLGAVEGVITPYEAEWSKGVYHLYVIRVTDRDGLQRFLSEKGCATGLHYPVPLHLQKAYEELGYKEGSFPVTEKVALEILSLPMFPELTEAQQRLVVEGIKEFLSKQG
jgi:dTDP-4-amino-4,6-dideoxygalactose transaminase